MIHNRLISSILLLPLVHSLTACQSSIWRPEISQEASADPDISAERSEVQTSPPDIFQERILDLSKGDGGVFEALRREQLTSFQRERKIDSAYEQTILPEGLLEILKEQLAEIQCSDWNWNMELLLSYEEQEHKVTPEQVQAYLGDAFPDHYDWGQVSCAYLLDFTKHGNEELVLFFESDSTGGVAYVDIWQKREDGAAEQLYNIEELRGYGALLNYNDDYYFVVREYNFNTRETEGFHILTAGAEGILQQYRIRLKNKDNRKDWIKIYHNKDIDGNAKQKITDHIETIKRDVEEKTVADSTYQLIDGSAETPYLETDKTFPLDAFSLSSPDTALCRMVDFDNDGQAECVKKKIWQPNSLGSMLCLLVDFYKEYDSCAYQIEVQFPCFTASDSLGTPVCTEETFDKTLVQLWFEEIDQKVYTFCLYRIEFSSDNLLEVSLIEEEELHPLFQYLLIAEKEYTFEQMEPLTNSCFFPI